MTPRTATRLAWCLAVATLAMLPVAAGIGLWSTRSLHGLHQSDGALVFSLTFPVLGAMVVQRRRAAPVGWLVLGIGASLSFQWLALQWARAALVDRPGSLPLGDLASWLQAWTWLPGWALALTLLPTLMPDGRPGRGARRVAWADGAFTAAAVLAIAVASWPLRGALLVVGKDSDPRFDTLNAIGGVSILLLGVLGLASLGTLVARFRRSGADVRHQLAWVVYGVSLAVAAGLVGIFVDLGGLFDALAAAALVGGLVMAVLRRRLYDIDLVVNRTLVYARADGHAGGRATWAASCSCSWPWAASRSDSGPAVAGSTLAVAALFRPARARIQGWVDRRFYRRRYDAQRTLEAFAARLRDEVDLGHGGRRPHGGGRRDARPRARVALAAGGAGAMSARTAPRVEPHDAMVTALILDVRGFTAFAHRATAREAMAFVDELFGLALPVVEAHGGHTHRLLGDGALVLFGLPEPLPDHADRALEAAAELSAAVERELGDRCRIGIGVNSGPRAGGDDRRRRDGGAHRDRRPGERHGARRAGHARPRRARARHRGDAVPARAHRRAPAPVRHDRRQGQAGPDRGLRAARRPPP